MTEQSGNGKSRVSRFTRTGPSPIVGDDILETSKKILGRVLMYIHDIAQLEVNEENRQSKQSKDAYKEGLNERRPHQAFLLDGARGSGKTTLLLTIQKYLEYVGNKTKWDQDPADPNFDVRKFLNEEGSRIDEELGTKPPSNRYKTPLDIGGGRAVACVLPILFPSDLEFSQTIMEGIIALLLDKLNKRLRDLQEATDPSSITAKKAGEALIAKLNSAVAAGWFLSNNVGMDAVLRDSADYNDFLEQRGKTNATSFARVTAWRSFVHEFLDYFGCELLAVFFDDTDLRIPVTRDILHTIRIFLDHPRIVTVIAGNLRSMRQGLLVDEMKTLRNAMRSLSRDTEATAAEWRRFARQQLEESLEKVLPRQFRMSITQTSREELERDYKLMLGSDLDDYCGKMLDTYRDGFLAAKHAAHFRWLQNRQEIVPADLNAKESNDRGNGALEPYSSWWLFRHFYREELKPRSARHMAALGAFTKINQDSDAAADKLKSEHRKRLSVILFESPENYEIVHRLNDHDIRILDWLRLNKIESCWRGNRTISINGQPIQEKTYSYHALCFRVDLELAKPLHENRDGTFHPDLLPQPAGQNLSANHPFFVRNRRQHHAGVAREMKHSMIPGNCIYINDLTSLPDVAWGGPDLDHDPWSHKLIFNWPKQFFFYVDELREEREDHKSQQDEKSWLVPETWIKDYFVKIVIPMASVSLGRFTPTTDAQAPLKMSIDDVRESTLLAKELHKGNEKNFFSEQIKQIETLIRRFDYLEEVAKGPGGSEAISKRATELLEHWNKTILNIVFKEDRTGKEEEKPTPEHIRLAEERKRLVEQMASYQWLLNDVRRAWHAARIFLNQTSETLKKISRRSDQQSGKIKPPEVTAKDHFSRADLYIVGTRATLDRWLNASETLAEFLNPVRRHDWTPENIGEKLGVKLKPAIDIFEPGAGFCEVNKEWLPAQVLRDIAAVIKRQRKEFDSDNTWLGLPRLKDADLADLFQSQMNGDGTPNGAWPFETLKLDPGAHPDTPSAQKIRTDFRLSRAFFLFLFGFSPSLPSLIHIEIAAILRNSGNAKVARDKAKEALRDWSNRIWSFLYFVQEFRRVLEFAKVKLDVMQLQREAESLTGNNAKPVASKARLTPEDCGVHMTMMPDFTYDQLGIAGLIPRTFDANATRGPHHIEFPDLSELQDAFTEVKKRMSSRQNRSVWQPMFDDVVNNLVEAINFIVVTWKTIPPST